MPPPIISLTETQIFNAIRSFLLNSAISSTEVIQAQSNRVPEPATDNFIIITKLSQERLATNDTICYDDVFVGSITGGVLTVTAFNHKAGPLIPGTLLLGLNTQPLAANTVLGSQITGTPGDTGTYNVSPSQTVSSQIIYAGLRADLLAAKLTVQIDFHGDNSLNDSLSVDALFRSEYGTDQFAEEGFDVVPLYTDTARQMPFINAEQQYEDRWTMDACLQINPVISTAQQFANQLMIGLVQVDPGDQPDPPPIGSTGLVIVGSQVMDVGGYEFFEDVDGNLVIRSPSGSETVLIGA